MLFRSRCDRGGDVEGRVSTWWWGCVVMVVRRECDMAELARVVEFFFGKVSGSYLSEFLCKEMSEWGSARPVNGMGHGWPDGTFERMFTYAEATKDLQVHWAMWRQARGQFCKVSGRGEKIETKLSWDHQVR